MLAKQTGAARQQRALRKLRFAFFAKLVRKVVGDKVVFT